MSITSEEITASGETRAQLAKRLIAEVVAESTSRHVPNSIGGALCGDSGGPLALPGETTTCPKCHNVVAHVRANLNMDCSMKGQRS